MAITEQHTQMIDGVELTPKAVAAIGRPTYDNVEDERKARKVGPAAALRVSGRLGYGEGVAGHITARDPEFPDHFWVNPFALSFNRVRVSDLLLVNHAGEVVIGDRPVNRAAFVLHAAIHELRPEVIAAAHAHSPYGKAFSSLGKRLDSITQDCCIFFNDHELIQSDGGKVVLEESAGQAFAAQFLQGKAAIHQNHGLFSVGESVDAAAFWFISMERCCQSQLLAEAAGIPQLIREDWATYTRSHVGRPQDGWLGFQSFWEDILHSDPELLQ